VFSCFGFLRKGEILDSVNEMTANEGFFEIQADDNEVLKSALILHPLQIGQHQKKKISYTFI
jgi:hypothetical protein